MSQSLVLMLAWVGMSGAAKIEDYAQGAVFDQCIAVADWEGKTLDDEITFQNRDGTTGCCPDGTVPGAQHKDKYVNAQIVCGFQADGSVAMSSSSSNGVTTCTYNTCYVWKQNLTCASGNQFLNGCCAAKDSCATNACGFQTGCKNYAYSMGSSSTNSASEYCATYDTNYALLYTTDKTDDQNTTLQLHKVRQFTPCTGGISWVPVVPTTKMTLINLDQGAKFNKCIKITDWDTKTLSDEIDVADRDANGCCPDGFTPGVKHYTNYVGAQVVCGFQPDGTVATSKSTSNGVKTCTYNQCYVWKQNLECTTGTQRLNGCCAAKADCTGGTCGFKSGCENYKYTKDMETTTTDGEITYCLTYNTNYEYKYTSDKGDDQANDKLQIDKVYTYTKCSGGAGITGNNNGGGGGGDGGGGAVTTTTKKAEASKAQWMQLGVAGLVTATLAVIANA